MSQLFGANELLEDVHQRELCIGCGACVALCPYFKNYKGKTAQLFPCNLSQGRCFAYCPKVEVDLDALYNLVHHSAYDASPLGPYRAVMAARAGENMDKGRFQGGGTVSALMAFALKRGTVDVAALTDREGLVPVSQLVTDWKAVAGYAGSKFMAAPTVAGVNQAVGQGFKKIGIVGTPCQMVAVAQMRANPLGKVEHQVPLALSIGLFCNWSLDTRQLSDYLAATMEISGIRAMDIPPPPAATMTLDTEQGLVEIALSDIKPLIPHTCFVCPDMTAELADLSVGMYEGRDKWNTLIVRSAAGVELVADAIKAGFLETQPMPTAVVDHLSKAGAAKKERALRTLIQRGLVNTTNGRRAVVRMSQEAMRRILPPKDKKA